MVACSVMSGSTEAGLIVQTPVVALQLGSVPGIWKLIVSTPAKALASWIAALKVQVTVAVRSASQAPSPRFTSEASPVELTTKGPAEYAGFTPSSRQTRRT